MRAALLSVLVLGIGLLGWQATTRGGQLALPGPGEVLRAAGPLLADPFYDYGPNDKGIGLQLLQSLRRLLTAYAGATALAVSLGTALGLSPLLFRAVNPYIQVLKTVSPLAWMPMFLYTVRSGEYAMLLVVMISTLWPILTSTAFGITSIDRDYLNVASVLQLSWRRRLLRVILPAAAPSILVGMRVAIGSAWVALVAAEMLVGGVGIGYFIWNEWNNLALSHVIVGIALVGTVGFLLDTLLGLVARATSYRRA